MHRKLIALAGLGLTTWATGCCMCDAPYDYCGPTFLAAPGEECVCDARMNSVFTPYVAAGDYEVIEGYEGQHSVLPGDEAPAPPISPDDVPPGIEPGIESEPAPPPAAAPQPTTTQTQRSRPVNFRR